MDSTDIRNDQGRRDASTIDPQSVGHDLKALTREVKALHASQQALAASEHLERLLKLIPRPGWTTPAEFTLVRAQISHMTELVHGLEQAQTALLKGADLVGRR
jgi:hypothetical protein